jgi:hypothetical protein
MNPSITRYLRAPSSNGLGGRGFRRVRHWIIRYRNAAQGRRDCDDWHYLKSPGEQRRWEYLFDFGLKLQEEQLALHQQAINNGQEHERSNHGRYRSARPIPCQSRRHVRDVDRKSKKRQFPLGNFDWERSSRLLRV